MEDEALIKNHRRCVSCRKVAPKSDFWRIVRQHPGHQLVLDQGMGRSVYLCRNWDCLKLAQKKDRLSRALKVKVSTVLYQSLEQRLESQQQTSASANLQSGDCGVTAIN
ncbi:YlxR family protein [filamentous cyanobacterium LEGE 11480]|uniref:YlxR family protein n=1 Tax=Romeriopsis navalis LEGE 11480 TaxID=2777977 RepID=A0A928VJU0_9CYAN|nr:YlxR family protein [Romeriopsis navalis]MBE9029655.1 YlxR family protein [Romeriopsis navalis LEGE 11480]